MKIRLFLAAFVAILSLSCASASTPFTSELFGPTKLSYGGLVSMVEKCQDIASCIASLDALISINEFEVANEDQIKHFRKMNENLCRVFDLSIFRASELETFLSQAGNYKTPSWREELAMYSRNGSVVQHVHLEATGLLDSTARTETVWHRHIGYGGTVKLNEYSALMKNLSYLMAERIVFYGKNPAFKEALHKLMRDNVAEDTVCKHFVAAPPPAEGEIGGGGGGGPADSGEEDGEISDAEALNGPSDGAEEEGASDEDTPNPDAEDPEISDDEALGL